MPGALHALVDTGGRGAGAQRTGVAGHRAGTVGFLKPLEVPALDSAGIALTFAGADHVHAVAAGEGVGLDDVADVQGAAVVQTKFAQRTLGSHVGFLKVALQGLGHVFDGDVAEADLNRGVAVVLHGLLLDNHAGPRFDDGDRDDVALLVEDLRHADLLADDSFLHVYTSLVIGWPPDRRPT